MRTILALPALAAAALLLGACGGSGGGALRVVAAENVYGDIAAQIGGRLVSVTSVLSSPTADPHLFQLGTRTGLQVAAARVVVQNGAGYDAFMEKLESAAPNDRRVVVTIADALGVRAGTNPHLWYAIPRLGRIAAAIAAGLRRADPAHAAAYRAGLARFLRSLRPLEREVERLRERFPGAPVAYTESVPAYLVAAAGLRNLAPAAFTRALEDGSDPSPQAVATMNRLVARRRIRVLLYNLQAVSPLTQRLRAAAAAHGIPVVGVTETLPPGRSFQEWQLAQTRALYRALSS